MPPFAIWLVFIDTILELFSNHNWVRSLLFTTKITLFNKSQYLTGAKKMIVDKRVINIWHRENIKYLARNRFLSEAFLTSQEKKWLHSEIWGDNKLYDTKDKDKRET